jgi:ribonuclease VapC
MIVDTSALVAILRAEPDAAHMAQALVDAEHARLSTANFVEAAAVIDVVSALRPDTGNNRSS